MRTEHEFETLKYRKEGHVALLTISRPKSLNALNAMVLIELGQAIDMVSEDSEVYALIITGDGKSFVAGADINDMKNYNSEEGREWGELGSSVFKKIDMMKIPTIAAVNGFALGGGCELAMACDLRIASENAKFGQPEVGLGITPGYSGCVRLPRLVGIAKAKELIYTGDSISACEAEKIGLVNKVVPFEELIDSAMDMAGKIASKAQIAVRYSKMAINRGIETDLETAIVFENQIFALCFATEDQKEGMNAFVEKRSPNFKLK
jgi:enoyl-CoA hydratase